MVASIRDATGTTVTNASSVSISRPSSSSGDVLLCIHSTNAGSLSDMRIQGSGWQTIGSRNDDRIFGLGGGTKIYRKTVGSSESGSYTVQQGAGAATVVMLSIKGGHQSLAVVRNDGDTALPPTFDLKEVTTPAASPPSGSGVDIRVAVAWDPDGSVSWPTPSGYSTRSTQQVVGAVSTVVVSKSLVTSASVGSVTFRINRSATGMHGFTIIVPSATTDESTPTPPSFPTFSPARGSALYRYTVHDLLSGAYRGDIYPRDVTFDRRIGEAGAFGGTLAIPNRRVADQVAEIIPRHASDLTSGPGRIVVHVWRAGDLWGEYWITGAMIQRSRRGGIQIQLRGSTLEAYLSHVPVEQDLEYEGDQISCARSLLNNMMSRPGANIGLTLAPGTAGDPRNLAVKAADATTYGDALRGYSQTYPSFEWLVTPTVGQHGGIERRWEWGAPTIEGDREHVFVDSPHGGDILDWSEEIDALRGGTRVMVRGGTPEVEDASEGSTPVVSDWLSATAHLAAGWPRYGQVVDHPGESTWKPELDFYAQRWIAALGGAVRVYSCTVALGGKPTLSPTSLGDYVRRVMVNEWHPRINGGAGFDQSQRLIGVGITPVSRTTGREEAQLILEEAHV
ncbi:hypothetical protein [Microbispora sp. CA-102843]|uniref:hypothetical protein n=1 Tax=Microbispora sp. CA-102843 TaxID=3239952 RepID=UPI003D90ABA2